MSQLQQDIADLRMSLRGAARSQKDDIRIAEGLDHAGPAPGPQPAVAATPAAASLASESDAIDSDQSHEEPLGSQDGTPAANHAGDRSEGFERQFGGEAFVWVGAVALAFAGFFLVKYSIETGLLSPTVRVAMGIIFGIGLLFAGSRIRVQSGFANGLRIGAFRGGHCRIVRQLLFCNESLRSDTGLGRFCRIDHCNGCRSGAICVARPADSLARPDGRIPHACPGYIAPSAGIGPFHLPLPGARRSDGGHPL